LLQIPLANDWQQLLQLAGIATHSLLQPLAFLENDRTNTQAGHAHTGLAGARSAAAAQE
jgi:hypothetical protein